ncbi:MAG: substrate-binding domain-containing protein [Lachnospiraceae bacterium]|nr:substrate-binding domain-containing protein [Lachnospiraceae bacterium]
MKKTILLFLVMLLLTGCGAADTETKQTGAAPKADDDSKIKIGMSFDSFVIERWIRDRDIFVSTAESLGAEVNVQSANGDPEEQIEQIRYLVSDGADVIVVVAVDCEGLTDVIKEVKSRGIEVISYDRLILNSGTDLYISFDNEEVGYLMGKTLTDNLSEGDKVFRIEGPLTDNNVTQVDNGYERAVNGKGLDEVYVARCDKWNALSGYDYAKEALTRYPDVKGIMCGNDDIASQVYKALSEMRLSGKVILTGQDGDLLACQRVVEGTQEVTVFKSVEEEAGKAAECAVAMAEGKELPYDTKTRNDGIYDVPSLELSPVAVTQENIDEVIIDGGYHARNELYK